MKTKKLISALTIAVFALTTFSMNANADNEKIEKEIWQELCKIEYVPIWAEWRSPTNSFNLFMKVKDYWIIKAYKRVQDNLNKKFWIWSYTDMIESWKFKKAFDKLCKEERFEEVIELQDFVEARINVNYQIIEFLILSKAKSDKAYKEKLVKAIEEFKLKENNLEVRSQKDLEKALSKNLRRLIESKDILSREVKKQCDVFSAFDVCLPSYNR